MYFMSVSSKVSSLIDIERPNATARPLQQLYHIADGLIFRVKFAQREASAPALLSPMRPRVGVLREVTEEESGSIAPSFYVAQLNFSDLIGQLAEARR
jgi:hypothetical protein